MEDPSFQDLEILTDVYALTMILAKGRFTGAIGLI